MQVFCRKFFIAVDFFLLPSSYQTERVQKRLSNHLTRTRDMDVQKETEKRVINLIIADESGSMSVIRDTTLAGLNETITTCQKMQEKFPTMEQRITLITFDSNHTKVIFDNIPALEAKPLSRKDYVPGAATPLYDAIGQAITKTYAQTEKTDNVLVTILTDGEENSSTEFDLKMVKRLIDKQKEQGWTFTFIGTDDLDVEGMAHEMGIKSFLSFSRNCESTSKMFSKDRASRAIFCSRTFRDERIDDAKYFVEEDEENEE